MQRYLLMQLLNSLLTSPVSLAQLRENAESYRCQGSVSKLRLLQAQLIADELTDVSTTQPTCWRPEEIEGAITWLVCKLVSQVSPPIL